MYIDIQSISLYIRTHCNIAVTSHTKRGTKMGTQTTARTVIAACANAQCFTLRYGYAVAQDGTRKLFEPCVVRLEKRNPIGRCTRMDAAYADGSQLRFTWHPERGAKLCEVSP